MSAYEEHRARIKKSLDINIPFHMVDGFLEYVCIGRMPGDFLLAVLENNLVDAAGRADDVNLNYLKEYALVLYNDVPGECWGSEENIREWMNRGGLMGVYEEIQSAPTGE